MRILTASDESSSYSSKQILALPIRKYSRREKYRNFT